MRYEVHEVKQSYSNAETLQSHLHIPVNMI
jgi:hypothetical protein